MVSIKAKEQFALYITPKVAPSSSNLPLKTCADAKNRSVNPCYKPHVKNNQTLGFSNSDLNRFRNTLLGNKAIGWALQNIWPQADCGRGQTKHNFPASTCQGRQIVCKKVKKNTSQKVRSKTRKRAWPGLKSKKREVENGGPGQTL